MEVQWVRMKELRAAKKETRMKIRKHRVALQKFRIEGLGSGVLGVYSL